MEIVCRLNESQFGDRVINILSLCSSWGENRYRFGHLQWFGMSFFHAILRIGHNEQIRIWARL